MSWPQFWIKKTWQTQLLSPLAKLVCWEASRRLKKFRATPPAKQTKAKVIVVGNVVVGGTGKTPFIIWLANSLQAKGLKVGIISRGYGAKNDQWPYWVTSSSQAQDCGDEPLMLYKQTGCAVAVAPKRLQALQLLNKKAQCDVVISDDGLQHYALARDIEIVLIDAKRQFGNGYCMPSGPLREPLKRITRVDFTVWNGLSKSESIPQLDIAQANPSTMQLQPACFRLVGWPDISLTIDGFMAKYPDKSVLAMAGIGNPKRFFETLENLGLKVDGKTFDDHYAYQKKDLNKLVTECVEPIDRKPLVMTEKDAVKCTQFAESEKHWWYLQVAAVCDDQIIKEIIQRCK
ncbi:tetraacyldisaccharide 4'-kinase [Thiomicrorhabdus immobilis]|uniref:Tetraacyldisaccharide 4'-kinase n=1 Tax=Thiomicrorhabdus immobilis TaxID=2791037 RepID=A0ABN6CW17_9GAMM|nr:tetraacyldisaccharide 4'-kinase [Thiomicrorhabdus immobilis]BCN93185.1 tetraacyldisaccharide 4'-kinase [Thiomicrorhabdus immobilis]